MSEKGERKEEGQEEYDTGLGALASLLGLAIGTHRECQRIVVERARNVLELERESGGRKTRRRWRYTRSGARCSSSVVDNVCPVQKPGRVIHNRWSAFRVHDFAMHADAIDACVLWITPVTPEPEQNGVCRYIERMHCLRDDECLSCELRMDVVCDVDKVDERSSEAC